MNSRIVVTIIALVILVPLGVAALLKSAVTAVKTGEVNLLGYTPLAASLADYLAPLIGIGLLAFFLPSVLVLIVGRRLALYRERHGYVRDEDLDDLGGLDSLDLPATG